MAESPRDDVRDDGAEFGQLVLRYLDQATTPEEQQLLETRLRTSDADRRAFLELCEQVCFVTETVLSHRAAPHSGGISKRLGGSSPIVTFLSDAFQAGADYLSRPFALSIFFTIVLPGMILLVLMVSLRSQPVRQAAVIPQDSRPATATPASSVPVAQVTRLHECEWVAQDAGLSVGDALSPGRPLRLSKGLLEVAFANGARVILQGPATFEAVAGETGRLRAGSLVASVSKKARGFTIQTPTAAVIDLGTEFGVTVDDSAHNEEVHVFRGEVVLETKPSAVGHEPIRHHLAAGSAASIAPANGAGGPVVHEIAFHAERYVRSLPPATPAPRSTPRPSVVAEFSGGQGKSAVDQFPGTGGSGWVSGWAYQETPGATTGVTVARDNPMLDGGDYLRVLVERKSGAGSFHRTIQRELDLAGPVDLKKPYVVSFSVRVDSLNRFDDPGDLLIFSNNVASRLKRSDRSVTSGWHIRMGSAGGEQVGARNWCFVSSDGLGNQPHTDSGIPVREGETYSFRISFDPPARQWVPSIAVAGGEPVTFGAMGMRSVGTAEECGYWPYLCISWYMAGGNQGANIERLGFSIDSIRITAAEQSDNP